MLAASARDAVRHDSEVAEFGAGAEAAAEEPVTGDDRPADARADREHDHVADEPSGPESELGPACGVRVVVDDDGRADARLELLAEGFVPPVDVRRVVHHRLRGVDEAGGSHAHRGDRPVRRERRDHRDDGVLEEPRVAGRCGDALASHDRAELVDDRAGDLRSADVDTDRVHQGSRLSSRGEAESSRGICSRASND